MTDPFRTFLERNGVSETLARPARIGQAPSNLTLRADAAEFDGRVDTVAIHQAYGRFGNNFYQIMNTLVIAAKLGAEEVDYPGLQCSDPIGPVVIDGIALARLESRTRPGTTLYGTFYAPFGFEHFFERLDPARLAASAVEIGRQLFPDVVGAPKEDARTLALHFRAGDIFTPVDYIHNWYVQPPASYYIKTVEFALASNLIDRVDLVFEDRGNPAIAVVEARLTELGVPFTAESGTLLRDLQRIATADYIAPSFGTFSEALGLMSRHLKGYFGFRSHSTQHDVVPFVQSRVGEILRARSIRTWLIDDVESTYISPRTWANSPEQHEIIRSYPIGNLRFFET